MGHHYDPHSLGGSLVNEAHSLPFPMPYPPFSISSGDLGVWFLQNEPRFHVSCLLVSSAKERALGCGGEKERAKFFLPILLPA